MFGSEFCFVLQRSFLCFAAKFFILQNTTIKNKTATTKTSLRWPFSGCVERNVSEYDEKCKELRIKFWVPEGHGFKSHLHGRTQIFLWVLYTSRHIFNSFICMSTQYFTHNVGEFTFHQAKTFNQALQSSKVYFFQTLREESFTTNRHPYYRSLIIRLGNVCSCKL